MKPNYHNFKSSIILVLVDSRNLDSVPRGSLYSHSCTQSAACRLAARSLSPHDLLRFRPSVSAEQLLYFLLLSSSAAAANAIRRRLYTDLRLREGSRVISWCKWNFPRLQGDSSALRLGWVDLHLGCSTRHPAWVVGSYSSGPPAGELPKSKSTQPRS